MKIMPASWRRRIVPLTAVAVFVAIAVTLVALTLRPPNIPTYRPTPAMPREAGQSLVGPVVYTVDATSPEPWRYFSFHLGSVVEEPAPKDWDLAFRRHQIIAGGGGILDLGEVSFADVKTVPETGYQENDRGPDPRNPAIASWYSYGFFSHILTPKRHVWAVRTADGRYAKMEILSYYCPGARAGCLTFRYVYQGSGSRYVGP